ncbi:MAG TPA: 7-carboxy-7-deazaguanine synthase QueE [Euryarchaeota archaeon]|nr:7-carboxy-7-deazaguanine synthase QueE [Euryarchaeota archaeon]
MQGYISEIFSSFQGEGGSVRGSCQGKRQIFIRFAGCNLAEAGRPCVWCDSAQAQARRIPDAKIETSAGSGVFKDTPNPLDVEALLKVLEELHSPDMHSLSLTGGEPLLQAMFIEEFCLETVHRIYLETNGTLPKAAKKVASHVDYACVDLKDETALPYTGWQKVLESEFETTRILKDAGAEVFAKIVVTQGTSVETITGTSEKLAELGVPLAIQPVTTTDSTVQISREKLFKLSEAAAQYLSADDITLSFQTHKQIGIL